MARRGIAYPLARAILGDDVLTVAARGPFRHLPGATLTIDLRNVAEASVKADRLSALVRIVPSGEGQISLMLRPSAAADMVRRLRDLGIDVEERRLFGRGSPA